MDPKTILDSLLDKSQAATRAGIEMAEDKQLLPPEGEERDAMLKGLGAGAAAAGALALLLGSKSGRRLTTTALKIGGTAAIGGYAYKALKDWQAKSGAAAPQDLGEPIAQLPSSLASARSEHVIKAMISAARADGHIDAEEQARIKERINAMNLEKDVAEFLLEEMSAPHDVSRIAALADSPEAAAEMYVASTMVIDGEGDTEKAYLRELAGALNLSDELVESLQKPVAS